VDALATKSPQAKVTVPEVKEILSLKPAHEVKKQNP
jgi:hypothetical protein